MRKFTEKWLAIALAVSLLFGRGSFVSLAESHDATDAVMEIVEVETIDGSDVVQERRLFPGVAEGIALGAEDSTRREILVSNMDSAGGFAEGMDCAENEILVRAEDEVTALAYADAYNGTLVNFYGGVATITLNATDAYPQVSVKDAVMASADPNNNLPVAWPNTYYYICEYNDPYLETTNDRYQWFHTAIGSSYAWAHGYTGSGVKVAVIDTGVKSGHQDLKATAAKVSSMGGSGDSDGHGTHVCGLVAGKGNNNKGGAGVAPEATLYSIKVSVDGTMETSDIVEALAKAAEYDVDIVNMSLGGPQYNGVLEESVKNMYKAGVAVFCAAGNDSTTAWAYPASYKGAISIAALDKSMQRTYFSNYGTSVDYSAPGYDIWSSYCSSTSSYKSLSGTSMACPIAAGTAAVLLQYARENKSYEEKNTSKDVDNLMKLMNKGVMKSGSGTGKGYVSLTKALGLGTSLKAPAAPVFDQKAGNYDTASLTITISSDPDTTVYYSTNGKTPAYKNGTVTNGTEYTGAFEISGSKVITVKAIAVSNAGKLVSKATSVKYTFNTKATALALSVEGGVNKLAIGSSLTVKAAITPSNVANNKLDWTVAPSNQGVTVKNGKVTASKKAVAGDYTIKATTKDGSAISSSMTVSVIEASANPVAKITKATQGAESVAKGASKQVAIQVQMKDKTTADVKNLTWSTENAKVAKVAVADAGNIKITGVALGRTNIYGVAQDGSGVKIKIPVTVCEKAKKVVIQGTTQLVAGKTTTLSATINSELAANSDLSWEISPADQGVTIDNGKVSATKNALVGEYTITATATDGSGVKGTKKITVTNSGISRIEMGSKKASIFRVDNGMDAATSITIPVTVTGGASDDWEVSTNVPGMVTVAKSGSKVVVTATGNAKGNATITVKTTDGSNKKATCKVSVKNPASNLLVAAPVGRCYSLAKGKSLQLKTTVETELGKVDSAAKKFKWSSSNESLATVNAKGKVTAKAASGEVTITATAADGSGVTASVLIALNADIKSIHTGVYSNWWLSKDKVGYIQVYINKKGEGDLSADAIGFKVSGNGLGVAPVVEDGTLYICCAGNKKGTYSVTMYCQNGSTASKTISVEVR